MTDASRLVRRAPTLPLVHLGSQQPASDVRRQVGERFPAFLVKERDFVFDVKRRAP